MIRTIYQTDYPRFIGSLSWLLIMVTIVGNRWR